jgi:DNA-binding NarL/FixJ family response regulator
MNIPLPRRDTRNSVEAPSVGVLTHVVVIHPVALMRRGIQAAIADSHVCEASDILSFESVVQAASAMSKLSAGDVVLMPLEDSAFIERENATLVPKGVSVVSMGNCDTTAVRLFDTGRIDAVISGSASAEDLVRAVVLLASGGRSAPKRAAQPRLTGGLGRLSQRQLEILELMTRGLLNKQIAWELGLTEGTVKSHVSAILEKLGCSRRTQAITAFMMSGAREFDRTRAA